jgi:hypothetical protein
MESVVITWRTKPSQRRKAPGSTANKTTFSLSPAAHLSLSTAAGYSFVGSCEWTTHERGVNLSASSTSPKHRRAAPRHTQRRVVAAARLGCMHTGDGTCVRQGERDILPFRTQQTEVHPLPHLSCDWGVCTLVTAHA